MPRKRHNPPDQRHNPKEQVSALLYARESTTKLANLPNPENQLADCRTMCQQEGWPIIGEYVDRASAAPDASGRLKVRPQYDALLERVQTEDRPVVVCVWRTDRIWREAVTLNTFLIVGREGALRLVAGYVGGVRRDPFSIDDEFYLELEAILGKREVGVLRVRARADAAKRAQAGKHNGGQRSWGYRYEHEDLVFDGAGRAVEAVSREGVGLGRQAVKRWGRLIVDEQEAFVIREVAGRLIGGEALWAVMRDLNRRSVPTVKGTGPWRLRTLQLAILAPRLAGLRNHHGQAYPSDQWEAILTLDEHEALKRALAARAAGHQPIAPRKYLLTGVLKCGICGGAMYVHHGTGRYGAPKYVCHVTGGGCGRVSIAQQSGEDAVCDLVAAHVASPSFRRQLRRLQVSEGSADAELTDRLETLQRLRSRLDDLERSVATDPDWNLSSYKRQVGHVLNAIEDEQRALDKLATGTGLPARFLGLPNELRDLLRDPEGSLEDRRQAITGVVERVIIHPVGRARGSVFDRSRIEPVWR